MTTEITKPRGSQVAKTEYIHSQAWHKDYIKALRRIELDRDRIRRKKIEGIGDGTGETPPPHRFQYDI